MDASASDESGQYSSNETDAPNGDSSIIHIDGRVLGGPMNKAEAIEYVVEHSQVEISDEDELNPICPRCETIEELAVQSSNIEGYLCPVCDDPTREIVE